MQVAIDSAAPLDEAGPSTSYMGSAEAAYGGYGPMRSSSYGRFYGSMDFDDVSISLLTSEHL